jgi:hypothetical protein
LYRRQPTTVRVSGSAMKYSGMASRREYNSNLSTRSMRAVESEVISTITSGSRLPSSHATQLRRYGRPSTPFTT